MPNETFSLKEPSEILPIQIMRLTLYGVIFLCGVIGNVLVILVVKCRGKKRTFHDYFLLNLAIADLLFIMCIPTDIYIEVASFSLTDFYCKILYPLTTFAFSLSIFTLTSMAVGRCYVMKNTSKPPLKGRAAFLWIAVLWVSSFGCVLPLTIVARSGPKTCKEDWPSPSVVYKKVFTASLLVLQYIGPLVIIALAYVNIAILLIESKSPEVQSPNRSQSLAHRIRHRNLQITRTLAVIVCLFALLMLPHEIAWMLIDFGPDPNEKFALTLIKFSPILTYLHSCSNPLVYGLMTSQFRNDVRKYIFRCKRFRRQSQSTARHEHENGGKAKKSRGKKERNLLSRPHIAEAMSTSHALGYGGKVNVIVYFSPHHKRTESRKTDVDNNDISHAIIKDTCLAKDSPRECLNANLKRNIGKYQSTSSGDGFGEDSNETQIIIKVTRDDNGDKMIEDGEEEIPNNERRKSPVKVESIDMISNDTNAIQLEIVEGNAKQIAVL